jgi:uncharacterized protein YjbI with pentapeptide repeats
MGARFHRWWQKTRKLIEVIGFITVLVVAIALTFVEVRLYGTGFAGKTLWDWLQLLIIPVVLAASGYLFTFTISRNERKAADRHNQTEREIARDNQREAALQVYIAKMAELLLHEKLRESAKGTEIRKIARVRTLTVLRRLDAERKGSVLQFLFESGLIFQSGLFQDESIVDLHGADLRGANLSRAKLCLIESHLNEADQIETKESGVNLCEVDLSKANLREASLVKADLSNANLNYANLREAILREVNLREAILHEANLSKTWLSEAFLGMADLSKADLSDAVLSKAALIRVDLRNANLDDAYLGEADLSFADLSGAKITDEELAKAKSLKGAIMPDGSIHP